MAWDNLASNQPVNGINLRDAVLKGLFTVKSGQTIPDNNKCFTKGQVYSLVDIRQLSGNRLVQKSQIIAASIQWNATSFGTLETVCGLPISVVLYSNSNVLSDSTYFYLDEDKTDPVFAEVFVVEYGGDKVKIETYTNGRLRTQEICGGIACGVQTQYSGGTSFPTATNIILGSGLGLVRLVFDSFDIPDKFQVIFDGVIVADTGYRGGTSYQSSLNAALAAKGLPPETINPVTTGNVTFNKTTTTSVAQVLVYAPLGGTAWTFTLRCPV